MSDLVGAHEYLIHEYIAAVQIISDLSYLHHPSHSRQLHMCYHLIHKHFVMSQVKITPIG